MIMKEEKIQYEKNKSIKEKKIMTIICLSFMKELGFMQEEN